MNRETEGNLEGDERFSIGTEAIVAGVVLVTIFLLSVYADPLGPLGFLVFIPFAALVATYILAFGGLVRRLT